MSDVDYSYLYLVLLRVCICVGHDRELATVAEPIEIPFGSLAWTVLSDGVYMAPPGEYDLTICGWWQCWLLLALLLQLVMIVVITSVEVHCGLELNIYTKKLEYFFLSEQLTQKN